MVGLLCTCFAQQLASAWHVAFRPRVLYPKCARCAQMKLARESTDMGPTYEGAV